MSKFIINGGKKLSGEIRISGSKNAVLPLIAATLLTDEECVLTNVPEIKDVETMVEILQDLGVMANPSDHTLVIRAEKITKTALNPDLVKKLRGSVLIMGALLARMKQVELAFPGGDSIGARPLDTHIAALKDLGAQVEQTDERIQLSAAQLTGKKIILEESSVTATENAILAASLANGQTIIKLAAMEPHVQQLCEFLNLMGAKISGIGTTTITIEGVKKLNGAKIEVIPDSEEAASIITLAAATKSELKVTHLNPESLDDYLLKLKKMNVNFEVGENFIKIFPPDGDYIGTKIQCGLYPKLNSDLVPPMAVLATQAQGETIIYEWLYENRLGYVAELTKMGAKAEILDPHRVKIMGPTKLTGAKITSYDLRMGITLVIAALVASGTSEIDGIEHVDRGYENLEGRLASVGADIKRV
ncbi:MAG: UDP-N-acetylglucosamine 1-carboxyvinyltransferase [Candidatus Doudnabacteria bacterium]|nr:UDP-N-acetylglucosamine 1-carboxyvinyltransferase [Candidatus Doudnabacteria bacterium]